MEEVEILPRDAYLHTVNITRAPCTLQWWFTTKRKNIDFGLFQRKSSEEASSVAGSLHEDSGSSTIGRQRGTGHFKLPDHGVISLMALKHYESSKSTIKGTWAVSTPGTYVLYFDNSFSKNTSKRVSFCVAVKEQAQKQEEQAQGEPRVDFSGWLLKKKRKRMQGWARRWFAVQGAWLVYSTTEGGVPRAKVDVAGAVVSASREDRSITIDADEGFFQLRGQTQQEYEAWVQALRKAKDAGEPPAAGATLPDQPGASPDAARAHAHFEQCVAELRRLLDAVGDAALRGRALEQLQKACASEKTLHGLAGTPPAASAAERGYPVALTASRASWQSGSDVFYDTNDVLELAGASAQHSPEAHREQGEVRDDDVSDDDGFSDRGSRAGSESSGRSSRLRQDLIRDPDFVEALARNSIQLGATPEPAAVEAEAGADDSDVDPRAAVTIDGGRRLLAGYEPRTSLPAPTCAASVSLISILRKNVGKDLSSIAMPLVMNEPINALQALCEELMYQRLLEVAAEQEDSLDRLMYVAAFAVSALSSKKPRAERKPFNPLLGETYEMVEHGFRFIAEKVSHHPPVMACYADAPAYRFWQDSSGKSKFWGKSMEIIQTSHVHVELPQHADHYTWAKPSALVRGLIAGPRTVDFTGEMTIVNHATGDRCAVVFKEAGLFSSSADEVECRLFRGATCDRVLRGCWSSHLRRERAPGQHPDTLWTAAAQPANAEQYYGFNYFTMRLNDLPAPLRPLLPHTDTRLRPDQRAYEEGRVEEAEAVKHELEEAQRARKRRRDEAGVQWAAKWFALCDDPYSPDGASWQYRGGYWAARAKHDFPPANQLW